MHWGNRSTGFSIRLNDCPLFVRILRISKWGLTPLNFSKQSLNWSLWGQTPLIFYKVILRNDGKSCG